MQKILLLLICSLTVIGSQYVSAQTQDNYQTCIFKQSTMVIDKMGCGFNYEPLITALSQVRLGCLDILTSELLQSSKTLAEFDSTKTLRQTKTRPLFEGLVNSQIQNCRLNGRFELSSETSGSLWISR